jgi:hypothetical protein
MPLSVRCYQPSMITIEQPESAKTTQQRPAGSDLQSEKIIDFFTARRALLKEAEAEDRLLGLEETIRLAAEQRRRCIRLPDPFGDGLLIFVFIAAVLLALLVFAGFG